MVRVRPQATNDKRLLILEDTAHKARCCSHACDVRIGRVSNARYVRSVLDTFSMDRSLESLRFTFSATCNGILTLLSSSLSLLRARCPARHPPIGSWPTMSVCDKFEDVMALRSEEFGSAVGTSKHIQRIKNERLRSISGCNCLEFDVYRFASGQFIVLSVCCNSFT